MTALHTVLNQIRSGSTDCVSNFTQLTPEHVSVIASELMKNATLRRLDLKTNYTGSIGLTELSKVLFDNTTLEELILSDNYLLSGAIEVYPNGNLKSYLTSQYDGLRLFCNALTFNKTLRYLDLSFNLLSSDGIIIVAESLVQNTALEVLKLNHTGIEYHGSCAIGNALVLNTGLRELWLKHNSIRNGFEFIAKGLQKNKTLRILRLDYNLIGQYCMSSYYSLVDALRMNNSLEVLDLSDNQIGEIESACILEALINNTTLRDLNLSANPIGTRGAKAISDLLIHNSTIDTLDLFNTDLDESDGWIISEALEKNSRLKFLIIGGNQISNELSKLFKYQLKINHIRRCASLKILLCRWIKQRRDTHPLGFDRMILSKIIYPMLDI